jgi:hypothetical protein
MFLLVLVLVGCHAKEPVPVVVPPPQEPKIFIVTVYSLSHRSQLATIYVDERATVPLANPFISDYKGRYAFFAASKDCCYVVAIRNTY